MQGASKFSFSWKFVDTWLPEIHFEKSELWLIGLHHESNEHRCVKGETTLYAVLLSWFSSTSNQSLCFQFRSMTKSFQRPKNLTFSPSIQIKVVFKSLGSFFKLILSLPIGMWSWIEERFFQYLKGFWLVWGTSLPISPILFDWKPNVNYQTCFDWPSLPQFSSVACWSWQVKPNEGHPWHFIPAFPWRHRAVRWLFLSTLCSQWPFSNSLDRWTTMCFQSMLEWRILHRFWQ